MRRIRLFALALLAVGFTACLDATQPNFATVDETTFDPSLGVDLANSTRTDVGVYYRDITVGTGTALTTGEPTYFYYRAYLSNGLEIDSLLSPEIPNVFVPGNQQLLLGLEIGLQGARVGGVRQVIVPPVLGYGLDDRLDGSGNVLIPGNSVLVFEVQLVNADGTTGATSTP